LLHLVGLFLKLIDLLASWPNICSELFDLVIKNELELLKLLGLLLQVVNAFVFVANSVLALGKFQLLRLNVRL
jgi:hypothetical protein